MAGLFDDLIPTAPLPPERPSSLSDGPAASRGGMFDDLIPAAPLPPARPAELSRAPAPAPTSASASAPVTLPEIVATRDGPPLPPPRPAELTPAPTAATPLALDPNLDPNNPSLSSDPGLGARGRAGGGAVDSMFGRVGVLTPDEAAKEHDARLAESQAAVAEAAKALGDAKARAAAMAGPTNSVEAAMRSFDQRVGQGDVPAAERALAEAQKAHRKAVMSPPPELAPWRDKTERAVRAVGDQIVDTATGLLRADLGLERALAPGSGSDPAFKNADIEVSERGKRAKNMLSQFFEPGDGRNEELGSKVVDGVASTAGFVGMGMAGGAMRLSPKVTTAVAGALPQAESMYQDATDALRRQEYDRVGKGGAPQADISAVPEWKRWAGFVAGLGVGASEAIPIGHLFERLERASGGGLKRLAGIMVAQGGEEALQEGMQTLLEDAAAKGLYDPSREIGKDLAENMLVGAISGAGIAGALGARNAFRAGREGREPKVETSSPEDIDAFIRSTLPPVDPAVSTAFTGAPARAVNDAATLKLPAPTPESPNAQAAAPGGDGDAVPAGAAARHGPASAAGPAPVVSGRADREPARPEPERVPDRGPVPDAEVRQPALTPEQEAERRLLLGAGFAPDQIDDMGQRERARAVKEAEEAGVEAFAGPLPTAATPAVGMFDDLIPSGADTGQNVPETPATLQAQREQLIAGERAVQMFPAGTTALPAPPPGMERVETPRGAFDFDPAKITADQVRAASAAGRENELLGLGPLSKPEVEAIAAQTGEEPVSIVERKPDGTEVRAALGTASTAPEQAAAIQAVASPGNTVAVEPLAETLAARTNKPKSKRAAAPKSLIQFLAAQGGLAPSADLDAMDLGSRFVPGHGRLIRKKGGLTLDQAREAAVAAGYLPDVPDDAGDNMIPGSGASTSSINDLLEALDEETRGRKRWSVTDEQAVHEREIAGRSEQEAAADDAAVRAAIIEVLTEAGIREAEIDPDYLGRAAELVLAGEESLENAYERAILQDVANDDAAREAVDALDIPWDTDDADSYRQDEGGASASPGRGKDGGPGEDAPGSSRLGSARPGAEQAREGDGGSRDREGSGERARGSVEAAAPPAKSSPQPAPSPAPSGASDSRTLAGAFADHIAGEGFANILAARRFAKEHDGTTDTKAVEEALEAGVVQAARAIVAKGRPAAETFGDLVGLYGRQPTLGTRTSTSMRDQAYSTPVPLAYVASQLAGITPKTTVYEPSAGNGALLIGADPKRAVANEINPERRAALKAQGFTVSGQDAALTGTTFRATAANRKTPFDRVIANPPFGAVTEDGATRRFDLSDFQSGYATGEVDHAISLRALDGMASDGRAVLIIGAPNGLKDRAAGYNGKAKREFFLTLYGRYNVVDHFTVSGDLYKKQGAGWPVDVIVVDGRGKSARAVPAADVPPVLSSWDEVGGKLDGLPSESRGAPDVAAPRARSGGEGGAAARDGAQAGGGGKAQPQRGDGEPGGVRPKRDRGEPGPALRSEGERSARGEPTGLLGAAGARPSVERRVETTETATQATYTPQSKRTKSLGTLVPVNMRSSVESALRTVETRRGDLDDYVAEKLGYKPGELGDYFGAEQIDALALAFDNIDRGAGFIIGDQTGIGKGRVNAAIIRYAIRNDLIPIFVTEKPNLFADMYRDLTDIGIQAMLGREPNILMTNASETFPLDEEGAVVLKGLGPKKHNELLRDLAAAGSIGDHDAVFTTYAQMQTVKGEETERQRFLRAIIPNAVLILDEAHNAGGQSAAKRGSDQAKKALAHFKASEKAMAAGQAAPPPPGMDSPDRAQLARTLVDRAKAAFYSSATWAKRPEVMDLYRKTDMRLAVESPEKLGETIEAGGVPLQQVVSSMLAQAGQYIRRERSFHGVSYDPVVTPVDRKTYDAFATSLAMIQNFSLVAKDAAKEIGNKLKAEGKVLGSDNAVSTAGADSANFTSVMHNLINQMLLSINAGPAAAQAVAALKAGQKPVIALASTNESFLSDYATDKELRSGDPIDIDFSGLLQRYLERSRWITMRPPFMEAGEEAERHYLTDQELGKAGVAAFAAAKAFIAKTDFSTLPVSPIDAIRADLKAAGYQVGEITGRSLVVDYGRGGEPTVLGTRKGTDRSVAGRRKTIAGFNGGALDAIILNQSGATGLSLHASERVADQRKRHMIIAQAEGNVDTHMQMLGRVHRTGQVVPPAYTQLIPDIPAAKRPAAVLAKKMASLNANTTASRKGALTAENVPDFMNQYGDIVANRLLVEEPEIADRLDLQPVDGAQGLDGLMRKVTGRIPLLPLVEQERLYARLEGAYTSFLEQLDAQGKNALEAKTLELDARPLQYVDVAEGTGDSPFAKGVRLTTYDVKRQGKPFTVAELRADLEQGVGKEAGRFAGDRDATAFDQIASIGRKQMDVMREEATAASSAFRQRFLGRIKDEAKIEAARKRLAQQEETFRELAAVLHAGARVRMVGAEGEASTGVVIRIGRPSADIANPLSLGQWTARVALPDGTRSVEYAFGDLSLTPNDEGRPQVQAVQAWIETTQQTIDAFDRAAKADLREERVIAEGNLLKAFAGVAKTGQIINFRGADGQIRPGIMLRAKVKSLADAMAGKTRVLTTTEAVARIVEGEGTPVTSDDGYVTLTNSGRGFVMISAEKAKDKGGRYYLDRAVTGAIGRDFYSRGAAMRVDVAPDRLPRVVEALGKAGAVFRGADAFDASQAKDAQFAVVPTRKPDRARSLSDSLRWTKIEVPDRVFLWLGLPRGGFTADYTKLFEKHRDQFASPADVRAHVEATLSDPDVAIEQARRRDQDDVFILLARRLDADRAVVFRAVLRQGGYNIRSAHILDAGQLEAKLAGARRAGAITLHKAGSDNVGPASSPTDEDSAFDAGRNAPRGWGEVEAGPPAPQFTPELRRQVTDIVARVAGPDVALNLERDIVIDRAAHAAALRASGSTGGGQIAGLYNPALNRIILSMASPLHAVNTAFHEAFHALQSAGVFTPQERAVLEREAPRLREVLSERIGLFRSPEAMAGMSQKEVEAYAFGYYAEARERAGQIPRGLHIAVRRAFERLLTIFSRVRNLLRGLGYQTVEDVFDRARSGEASARKVGAASARDGVSFEVVPDLTVASTFERPGPMNRRDETRTYLQDRFHPLARVQRAIREATGEDIRQSLDTYLATDLYPGRVGDRLRRYHEERVDTLVEAMKAERVSYEDVGAFLYARHAPERNAMMALRDPERFAEGGGSGMTDGEAAAVLADFAEAGKTAALDRLAERVDTILAEARDVMLESGLIGEAQHDALADGYRHYVPLRGFAELDPDDVEAGRTMRVGQGFNMRGKEVREALGRLSLADSPLAQALQSGEQAIIRAEKNRVAQALLRMAQAYPNPEMWRVDHQKTRRVLDRRTGLVKTVPDVFDDRNVITAKFGGKARTIEVYDPEIVEALKGIGDAKVIPYLGAMTRLFSKLQTSWNPEFFVSNMLRDVQAAALHLTAEERKGLVKAYTKAYPGALKASTLLAAGRSAGPKWDALADEWRSAGGQISFNAFRDASDYARRIEKTLTQMEDPAVKRVPREVVKALIGFVEGMNEALENATRLAVFKAAKDAGYTTMKAASLAREGTVNFNRRGKAGPAINSAYAFFNAAVQGQTKLAVNIARSKHFRIAFGSFIGIGAGLTLFNLAWSGTGDDDDDPIYMDIPDWDRASNFIVMLPFGSHWSAGKFIGKVETPRGRQFYLKIPTAFELKIPHRLGEQAVLAARGHVKPIAATMNVAKTTMQAFNPLGEGSLVAMLFPTLAKPVAEIKLNENFAERAIVPGRQEWNKGVPQSEQPFPQTNPLAIATARALNKATGGDRFAPGVIDLYPGHIEYAFGFLTGGLGRFVGNAAGAAVNAWQDVPTPIEKSPILRRFMGETGVQADNAKYREAKEEAKGAANRFNAVKKALEREPDDQDVQRAYDRAAEEAQVRKAKRGSGLTPGIDDGFEAAEKHIEKLRKEQREVRSDKGLSPRQRHDETKRIEAELSREMIATRRAYERDRAAAEEFRRRPPPPAAARAAPSQAASGRP